MLAPGERDDKDLEERSAAGEANNIRREDETATGGVGARLQMLVEKDARERAGLAMSSAP